MKICSGLCQYHVVRRCTMVVGQRQGSQIEIFVIRTPLCCPPQKFSVGQYILYGPPFRLTVPSDGSERVMLLLG